MLYDYKSKSAVQDVILDSIEKLTENIKDEYESLRRYDSLVIYLPAFLAREIVGEILDDEYDVWINDDSYFDLLRDDNNEVLVTLAYDGMIFIEQARYDGRLVIDDEPTLIYVYDGFSKRDVDYLSSKGEAVLVFGFDEDALDEDNGYVVNGVHTTKEVFDKYVDRYITGCAGEENGEDQGNELSDIDGVLLLTA